MCFSGRFETATILLSQVKILLLPSSPNYQVQKACFLSVSELCRLPRTHCTIPWEKRSGEECSVSIDSHTCCYPDLVKWYCQMTSKSEVASSLYLSENSNTWPNLMLYWRQKWTSVFFWQVWGCNDPYSKRKIELLQSGPKSQVQKNVFPCNFQAV